jgi:hypothetical protein
MLLICGVDNIKFSTAAEAPFAYACPEKAKL